MVVHQKAIFLIWGIAFFLSCVGAGAAIAQSKITVETTRLMPPQQRVGASLAIADSTLRYFSLVNGIVDYPMYPDSIRAAGVFFTAPFDGTIDQVDFELSNFPPSPDVTGAGKLRIKLVPAADVLSPATAGVDSLDVDFSALQARSFIVENDLANQIDLTSRNFEIEVGEEYFLQLAMEATSSDAALSVVFDGGSADTTDHDYYPARSFVYVPEAMAPPGEGEGYFPLEQAPPNEQFQNLNLLIALHLTEEVPPPPTTSLVQYIHSAPHLGTIDIYVGNRKVVDNLVFQKATSFTSSLAGPQQVDVVEGTAIDNASPLFSTLVDIASNKPGVAVVLGTPNDSLGLSYSGLDLNFGEQGEVQVLTMNSGIDVGAIQVNAFYPVNHQDKIILADSLAFGHFASPVKVAGDTLLVEVIARSDQSLIDVYQFTMSSGNIGSASLVLLASGIHGAEPTFNMLAVNGNGQVDEPDAVVTSTESDEVVTEVLYLEHFPNPVEHQATISFGLGTTQFVSLKVFNLLGQEVTRLVAERLPAGRHAISFETANLTSGLYFYRLEMAGFVEQRTLLIVK